LSAAVELAISFKWCLLDQSSMKQSSCGSAEGC
jgi:hypothetical protein